MKLEKCDLCGGEVRHIHSGAHQDGTPCKICCTCRDNLEHPLETMLKDLVPPHGSFNRIPCFIDEVIDLDDEALVALYRKAFKESSAADPDSFREKVGIANACAKELDRRERGYLLAKEGS